MNTNLLSNKIKEMRIERSWSQAQLAHIAGISLRTVQRIESNGSCSKETMLAIASAFDIEVRILTKLKYGNKQFSSSKYMKPLLSITDFFESRNISQKKIFILSLAFSFPAIYFFTANILKYNLGVSWFAQPLEYFYSSSGNLEVLNFWGPFIFLGGLAISLLLSFLLIINFSVYKRENGLNAHICLKPKRFSIIISGLNLVILFSMIGYALIENSLL